MCVIIVLRTVIRDVCLISFRERPFLWPCVTAVLLVKSGFMFTDLPAMVGITPNTFGVPSKSNAVVQLSARLAQLAVLLFDTDLVLHVFARL